MSIFAVRLGFALAVGALCLGEGSAHAQSGPVKYWNPGWLGFGGTLNAGQVANTDGSLATPKPSGFFATSTNFRSDEFNQLALGNALGVRGIGAFGTLESQGSQFGYAFQNSPLTVYAGFDSLNYRPAFGAAPFDSMSGTIPGYAAHAGIEYKPTSNLSLSLGVGYVQQSGRIDSDTASSSLSSSSQYDLVRARR